MLKDIELHEKYIVDEGGNRTGVILEKSEFDQLLAEMEALQVKVQELLEELEMADDVRAFDEAMKATGEDAELILFEQAMAEIEQERAED
jgi:hypothetical protein